MFHCSSCINVKYFTDQIVPPLQMLSKESYERPADRKTDYLHVLHHSKENFNALDAVRRKMSLHGV